MSYAVPAEPRTSYCGPDGLWKRREAVLVGLVTGLGAVGLLWAWWGAAGEAEWRDTARWIVLAVVSVAFVGVGLVGWVLTGKVRVLAAHRAVARNLGRRLDSSDEPAQLPPAGTYVTAARMRLRHRRSCLLMRGKTAVPVDPRDDALRSCGVCDS